MWLDQCWDELNPLSDFICCANFIGITLKERATSSLGTVVDVGLDKVCPFLLEFLSLQPAINIVSFLLPNAKINMDTHTELPYDLIWTPIPPYYSTSHEKNKNKERKWR